MEHFSMFVVSAFVHSYCSHQHFQHKAGICFSASKNLPSTNCWTDKNGNQLLEPNRAFSSEVCFPLGVGGVTRDSS